MASVYGVANPAGAGSFELNGSAGVGPSGAGDVADGSAGGLAKLKVPSVRLVSASQKLSKSLSSIALSAPQSGVPGDFRFHAFW